MGWENEEGGFDVVGGGEVDEGPMEVGDTCAGEGVGG